MFLSILSNEEKEDFLNLVINVAEVDGDFTQAGKLVEEIYLYCSVLLV